MRVKTVSTIACIAAALAPSAVRAAEGELVARPLGSTDAPYGHLEYVPPGYADDGAEHPVVLFLHGLGESGDGITNLEGPMKAHGPGKLIDQGSTYFAEQGALVFMPQTPVWWDANTIHQFLGYVAANFRVDPRRVYITGLSMGGGGTWSYASSHPGRATAILPICGAADPGDAAALVDVPVWAFHAWSDPTVPRTNSIGWVDHIADAATGVDAPAVLDGYPHVDGNEGNAAATDMTASFDGTAFAWTEGAEVSNASNLRLTLYPDGSHDSWTRTYDVPAHWDWLVEQRKASVLDDDTYIVDNLEDGVTFTGEWTRSEAVPGFYWWDVHELAAGPDTSASFSTPLPPAIYEVYVSWTAGPDRAQVTAQIDGALEAPPASTLDMTQGGGFTSLGQFTFDGGAGTVTLAGAEGATGLVIADAVGFVHRADLPGVDSSSGGDDTGDVDTGGAEGTGDVPGGDVTGAGTDAATSEGTGGGAQDDDAGGCGCTATPGGGAWWAIFGAALRRRRRQSS